MIIGFSRAAPAACDPYFGNCVLLLPFEDVNGSTTAPGLTDQSPAAHGDGFVFGGGAINTSQKEFGVSSFRNSGIFFPNSTDFLFGSGNFTLEGWIRQTAITGFIQFLLCVWESAPDLSWVVYLNAANKLAWNTSTTGSDNNFDMTGSTVLVVDTWYHWAVDFDGTKYRLYLNGVMEASFATPRTLFASTIKLGISFSSTTGGLVYTGYQDEIRITKGVARYASDGGFTVPTSAFPTQAC